MRLEGIIKLAEIALLAKSSQMAGKELFQSAVSYIVVLLVGMVVSLVSLIAAVGLTVAGLITWAVGGGLPILFILGGTAFAMVGIAAIAWYVLVRAKKVSAKVQDMLQSEEVFDKPEHDPLHMGKEILESVLPKELLRWRDAFVRGWEKSAHGPLH